MKISKPIVKLSPKENILGFKTNSKKLVDSDESLSKGGRAFRWWVKKAVKRSSNYEAAGYQGNLDQYDILRIYSIRGFEYGNWLNNNDRHDCLDAAAESFENLSSILGTKNIGCDGKVGLAFGARGMSPALAHFEPGSFMINLTKEKGFGSLAHEYGHALDYFFGLFIDQSPNYSSLVGGRSLRINVPEEGGTLRRIATRLVNEIIMDKGQKSVSYEVWEKISGEYWIRRNEIFARTFEQWMRYKMDQKGIKNTFLSKKKYEDSAYLKPADFKRVLPLMEQLVKEMAAHMNNKKTAITPVPKQKTAAKTSPKTTAKPKKTTAKPKKTAKKQAGKQGKLFKSR